MNLYFLKTSRGGVYYVVADTMTQALEAQSISNEGVICCEVTATSIKSGDFANFDFPKLIVAK